MKVAAGTYTVLIRAELLSAYRGQHTGQWTPRVPAMGNCILDPQGADSENMRMVAAAS